MTSLSKYDIIINLIPGIIFIVLLPEPMKGKLDTGTIWQDMCLSYFSGLIIGRIGSLIIEPVINTKFFNYALVHRVSYSEYVLAKKLDEDIELLNEKNTLYRTMSALCFCVFITVLYIEYTELHDIFSSIIQTLSSFGGMFLFFAMLFVYAIRKQSMYVVKRVEVVLHNNHVNE